MFSKWLDPALLLLSALTLVAGGVAHLWQRPDWASMCWAAGSVVMALVLLVEIVRRLARHEAGVDMIALLSITAALAFAQTLVAAVIALMLASGRTLEFFTSQRAERELRALIDRAPRSAWLQEAGGLREIPVEQIQPNQTLLVRLGEVVPVDGRLLSPTAELDESALSGESLPVTRREGEQLPSGVSNVGAPLLLSATRTAAQSTYAGIVRLAEEARRSRAPFVRLADRYALFFIPLTLLIAAAAWQLSGDPLRALAVLVVATPCPLILAVPISIMSGISRAARRGILIKDGATLEALAGVKQVFLDKTGTLTSGHARLQSIEVNGLADPLRLLGLAASLAQASTHPICQAIVDAAHQRQLPLSIPRQVDESPGAGLCGVVDGRRVRFGTLSFAHADAPASDWGAAMLRHMDYLACSGSFIDVDGELAGLLVFSDNVRRETPQTLRRLRARGIERIVMLTGDRLETAEMVALSAGIDELRAGLIPEDKVRAVQEGCLRASTLMVGDGINDAPALAAANVGVAMGASGATASAQAAGVVLLVDRLDRLVEALDIARQTRHIARQGVLVGMGMSLLAMVVAALGYLPPLIGAVVQEGIDVAIIINALRALGPLRGVRQQRLAAQQIDHLQDEHKALSSVLSDLHQLAIDFARRPLAQAQSDLQALVNKLQTTLARHEREDENTLYPQLTQSMPGEDPMSAMSHAHREIFRLIHLLARMSRDFCAAPETASADEIQHQLIRLDTLVRMHFDQEEELFRYLDWR
ncbi:heavy metal translocating P-type ATPase [Pseudomonas umsongensis]|jgi:heavy metal translocating P-type ATPase|uniref:heavy metal translocating P-type ATPase n=1 Tax=Pseudomonas umsongensis TaxID=198618 RepID=UPI00200B58A9|nr:heavy metal translocating P-type ATPase [Pseudomonas umsongensis]MCK8687287.1 heavy metal translocating P-type ATPase [Pseudomonas umsongensis]